VEIVLDEDKDDGIANDILPDAFKTKPNLDRKGSEPPAPPAHLTTHRATNGDATAVRKGTKTKSEGKKVESVLLKDRDWRGEEGGVMFWETLWDGMDGIGGTNKKGKKCFDKVRIWWGEVSENDVDEE
jgi:hypothetical protein